MQKILAVMIVSLAMFSAGCDTTVPPRTMGWKEAQREMEVFKDHVIIDVRTPAEYRETRIAKALNVPLDALEKHAADVIKDKDQMVFVYCKSGRRSKLAADALAQMGYTDVIDLGGIDDWLGPVELERYHGPGITVGGN